HLRPSIAVFDETIGAWLDLRALGELPAGAKVVVELRQAKQPKPLATASVVPAPPDNTARVVLRVPGLRAGKYTVAARANDRRGRQVGEIAMETIDWPEKPRWPDMSPDAKVLNCLVTELLAKRGAQATGRHRFVNPRDGWVFVRVKAAGKGHGSAELMAPGASEARPLMAWQAGETSEAMRWLRKGEYELVVRAAVGGVEELVVRAVPELVFCQFGAHPHVREYGLYDWDFLARHVLPHVNTIVGGGAEGDRPYVEQWRGAGKRWLTSCGVPGLAREQQVTADEAEQYWRNAPGMADPVYDGVIADEFYSAPAEKYAAWTEALRRLRADPALHGKQFYAWVCPIWNEEPGREFIRAVTEAGWRLALERYLPEQPSEEAAWAYIRSALAEQVRNWQQAMPGIERHLIMCLGYLSQPPESLNVNPGVDFKVFMDMEFYHLANDPTFFGLYGVMEYLSSYCDEENVRWAAKLYRHYCIEGRSDRLTSDPYILPHLANPDFAEGLVGWEVREAEPGSVSVKTMEGFSWLQGRYPRTSQGDQFLCLRRSDKGPNFVSQTVRHLQPGRLYSLKLYAADWQHLERQQKLALAVRVEGVELLPDRCFVHVFPNCYSHHYGPFNAEHRAWFNYHWQVFRARSREARLVISDWVSSREQGGPVGQEIAVNFVELQPYMAE
ncbi:MAG: hypothetical protein H5T86_01280, partial [Armatimonadetes bacterium]|nr:hypothetical protein [Armatimonadota bacterium]